MLNRSASLAISTSVLKALPGKLDIKRHSPSILYLSEFSLFVKKTMHLGVTSIEFIIKFQYSHILMKTLEMRDKLQEN